MKKLAIILVLIGIVSCQTKADHQVQNFPGWGDYNFQAYSGILKVRQGYGDIHYVFLTSQGKSTDPVVLWLNGGPGCSSMLGLMTENGPFLIPEDTTTFSQTPNPYSWNKVAHMLYFQSPPDVGFSKNFDFNYVFNETNTAKDNWDAIISWLDLFPEYLSNKFWIAGESYAGMYIPFTAEHILKQNKVQGSSQINLKGIMIGNGVFNLSSLENATYWFNDFQSFYGPALTSIWENQCQKDYHGPKCQYFKKEADKLLYQVDPYNVFDECWGQFSDNAERFHPIYNRIANQLRNQRHHLADGGAPCVNFQPLTTYFNSDTVQTALHVPLDRTWAACADIPYQKSKDGSFNCYLNTIFKEQDFSILIYSGDSDSVVPFIDTIENIQKLQKASGGSIVNEWHQWITTEGQVGGQATQYSNLQFTTVRGAGHMVPMDNPQAAFYMFNQTLNGIPL